MRWYILIVCCTIGLMFGGIGAWTGYFKYQLKKHGLLTKGVVVDNERYGKSLYPVVEFVTQAGQKIRDRVRETDGAIPIGTAVEVLYDTRDESRWLIAPLSWTLSVGLFVFGMVFTVIGTSLFCFFPFNKS